MRGLRYVILIWLLVIAACKPSKEISNDYRNEYLVTILLYDTNGEINNALRICFQLQPSGPPEIKQIGSSSDIVEMKIRVRGLSNDRLDAIKGQLSEMTNVISVSIQRAMN